MLFICSKIGNKQRKTKKNQEKQDVNKTYLKKLTTFATEI